MNKVILSTGIGKLHLIESALALHKAGCPVEVITGWRPEGGEELVNFIGKLIGQNNLAKRLAARCPADLKSVPVYSCTLAEGFAVLLNVLCKYSVFNSTRASVLGFTSFGRASQKFIQGSGIFHVRSGAGQGGAIAKAREKAMKIMVDHSIAHPVTMKAALQSEFNRFGLSLNLRPEDKFWQLILQDCVDADLLLVNSDYVRDTFLEIGYPAHKIHVAYLGVRRDFFGLKQNYQICQELRLLFIGHFDLRKGVRILLEALEILQQRHIDYRLDVVGFIGSGKCALKEHTQLRNIHFHPFLPQEELKQFLTQADIFVFPTFAEGSSRSAMEALAAGLPVITTKNCGVPIEHGINGWYVPIGNSESLAEAIQHLSSDENLRKQLGTNAKQIVAEKYTWENYAQTVIAGYQKLTM